MDLYPAIDLRAGKAVRLFQGDFAKETVYGDPLALAGRYIEAGARWIHVVDLDAAKTGDPINRNLVLELRKLTLGSGVRMQVGGGIRGDEHIETLLGAGVDRVVLSTAVLEDPKFAYRCAGRYPLQIAIGLDYRVLQNGTREPASRGWTEGSGLILQEVVEQFDGLRLGAIVLTSISQDGTLLGPDLEGLAQVLGSTAIPVIASGGVGTLAHLEALGAMEVWPRTEMIKDASKRRLGGVIAGKALLEGKFGIEEAAKACATSG